MWLTICEAQSKSHKRIAYNNHEKNENILCYFCKIEWRSLKQSVYHLLCKATMNLVWNGPWYLFLVIVSLCIAIVSARTPGGWQISQAPRWNALKPILKWMDKLEGASSQRVQSIAKRLSKKLNKQIWKEHGVNAPKFACDAILMKRSTIEKRNCLGNQLVNFHRDCLECKSWAILELGAKCRGSDWYIIADGVVRFQRFAKYHWGLWCSQFLQKCLDCLSKMILVSAMPIFFMHGIIRTTVRATKSP